MHETLSSDVQNKWDIYIHYMCMCYANMYIHIYRHACMHIGLHRYIHSFIIYAYYIYIYIDITYIHTYIPYHTIHTQHTYVALALSMLAYLIHHYETLHRPLVLSLASASTYVQHFRAFSLIDLNHMFVGIVFQRFFFKCFSF